MRLCTLSRGLLRKERAPVLYHILCRRKDATTLRQIPFFARGQGFQIPGHGVFSDERMVSDLVHLEHAVAGRTVREPAPDVYLYVSYIYSYIHTYRNFKTFTVCPFVSLFFFFGYVWETATGERRGNFGRDRTLLLIICHGILEMFSSIVVMLFFVQNCLKFGENVELDLNITGVGDQ
jgi:hypothetical protein